MKNVIILFALILGNFGLAQQKESSLEHTLSINQNGALKLAEQANLEAAKLNKQISIAILNNSGLLSYS
nr:hypothetical protein [Riemerella anatipestifer]